MDSNDRPLSYLVAQGWEVVGFSTAGDGKSGAWHISSPFHCWPHQQRPSVSMMQVPLPQQRGSSLIGNSLLSCRAI